MTASDSQRKRPLPDEWDAPLGPPPSKGKSVSPMDERGDGSGPSRESRSSRTRRPKTRSRKKRASAQSKKARTTPRPARKKKVVGQKTKVAVPETPKVFRPEYPTSYTHEEFWDADLPVMEYRLRGILPNVELCILCGRPKRGKSTLCRHCAVCYGSGRDFLDRPFEQGKVVYFCLEESQPSVKAKLHRLGIAKSDLVWKFEIPPLNTEKGFYSFQSMLEDEEPDMVVIDSLTRAYRGMVDWNSQGVVTALFGPLQQLGFLYQCLILGTDHMGKAASKFDRGDPVEDLIGSTSKAGIADAILGLYKTKRGDTTIRELCGIGRSIDQFRFTIDYTPGTERYRVASDKDEEFVPDGTDEGIFTAIDDLGENAFTSYIAKEIGMSTPATSARLSKLHRHKLIVGTATRLKGLTRLRYTLPEEELDNEEEA